MTFRFIDNAVRKEDVFESPFKNSRTKHSERRWMTGDTRNDRENIEICIQCIKDDNSKCGICSCILKTDAVFHELIWQYQVLISSANWKTNFIIWIITAGYLSAENINNRICIVEIKGVY